MKKINSIAVGVTFAALLIGSSAINVDAEGNTVMGTQSAIQSVMKKINTQNKIAKNDSAEIQKKLEEKKPDVTVKIKDQKNKGKDKVTIDLKDQKDKNLVVELEDKVLSDSGELKLSGLDEKQDVYFIVDTNDEDSLKINRSLKSDENKTSEQLNWIFADEKGISKTEIEKPKDWQGEVIAKDVKEVESKDEANSNKEDDLKLVSPLKASNSPELPNLKAAASDPQINGNVVAEATSTVGNGSGNTTPPEKKFGELIIKVADLDDKTKVLEGAVFELKNSKGDTLKSGITSGKDGSVSTPNLEIGDFKLVQTKALAGYELNSTPSDVKIEDGKKITVTFYNKKTATPNPDVDKGNIKIVKVDQADNRIKLAGAVFNIVDEKGIEVISNLRTNASGEVQYNGLLSGKYGIIEITAPNGYQKNAKEYEFTIAKGANGKTETVVITGLKEKPVTPTKPTTVKPTTTGQGVTDLRGTAAGWHVTAELSDFKTTAGVTLTGVQLFFPEVANWTTGNETNTDETKPTSLKDSKLKPVASGAELDGVTIAPGTAGKKTIIRAEDKHGAGRWNVEYSKTAENANTPIYVKIPAGNQVGSYTADLTYGLVDAPIA